MPHTSREGRRRFLKTAGLVGLTGALARPAAALAQAAAPPAAAHAPADTVIAVIDRFPKIPPPPSEDARALAGLIQRRYGKDLTGDQIDTITKDLDGDLEVGKRLRGTKLTNADEPDFTFHA